jgi:hypothetical protein
VEVRKRSLHHSHVASEFVPPADIAAHGAPEDKVGGQELIDETVVPSIPQLFVVSGDQLREDTYAARWTMSSTVNSAAASLFVGIVYTGTSVCAAERY